MAAKPETTFYTSVHRHLPPLSAFWREKMANPYRGGTFDHWYDGSRADLWVEWKFIELPKRDDTVIDLVTPRGKRMESPLSALQQEWGSRAARNGRNVWVVVGCKEGGVILTTPVAWSQKYTASGFRTLILSRQQIAQRIEGHCL